MPKLYIWYLEKNLNYTYKCINKKSTIVARLTDIFCAPNSIITVFVDFCNNESCIYKYLFSRSFSLYRAEKGNTNRKAEIRNNFMLMYQSKNWLNEEISPNSYKTPFTLFVYALSLVYHLQVTLYFSLFNFIARLKSKDMLLFSFLLHYVKKTNPKSSSWTA